MSETLKVKVQRGLKANLPILSRGELAYTTDTNELFIGVLAEPTNVSDNVLINNIPFATKNEAETGIDETKVMNPLRTSEAIAFQAGALITSENFVKQTDIDASIAAIGGDGLVFDNINEVYNLDYADNAEALAGSSTTKVITPATLDAFITSENFVTQTEIDTSIAAIGGDGLVFDNINEVYDVTGVVETKNNDTISFWVGTQAEYDAIPTKNSNTLYFIEE